MPNKSAIKAQPRTLEQIRIDIDACNATCAKLRRFLDKTMSVIRAQRFQPYTMVANAAGVMVRKRHPALKDLREYTATLRAAREHLAALRAEETALLKVAADVESNPWSEFTPNKPQGNMEAEKR